MNNMTNNMKKFSLDKYLKNPSLKIVTRDGRAVKILCTDRKDFHQHPIVALVQTDGTEQIYDYMVDGSYIANTQCSRDLFFAPKRKSGWVNIYKYTSGHIYLGELYNSKEDAEINANNCENHTNTYYVTTIKIEWEE